LDGLDAIGGRATFFVLGEQVERYPSLLREIVARGHELAVHGYEHLRHDAVDSARSRTDILRAVACLEHASGVNPKWFRPPYGRPSEGAMLACEQAGLTPVYWSAWGLDWEPLDAQRIAEYVCRNLTDGAIVLLHDSAHYAIRTSARPTAAALALIGQAARERDLGLVTLGETIA
jgi:peptidoglycan/xylan/chitin deacetylase (PgdA/CDA1 family)